MRFGTFAALSVCLLWATGGARGDDTDSDGVSITSLGGKWIVTKTSAEPGVLFTAEIVWKESEGLWKATTTWTVTDKDKKSRPLAEGETPPLRVLQAPRLNPEKGVSPTVEHPAETDVLIVGWEEDVVRARKTLKYLVSKIPPAPSADPKTPPDTAVAKDEPKGPMKGAAKDVKQPDVAGGVKVVGHTTTKLNGQVRYRTVYMSDGTARRVFPDGRWQDMGETPLPVQYTEGGEFAFGDKVGGTPKGTGGGAIAKDLSPSVPPSTPRIDNPAPQPPARREGYFTYQGKTYLRSRGQLYELC